MCACVCLPVCAPAIGSLYKCSCLLSVYSTSTFRLVLPPTFLILIIKRWSHRLKYFCCNVTWKSTCRSKSPKRSFFLLSLYILSFCLLRQVRRSCFSLAFSLSWAQYISWASAKFLYPQPVCVCYRKKYKSNCRRLDLSFSHSGKVYARVLLWRVIIKSYSVNCTTSSRFSRTLFSSSPFKYLF